MESVGSNLNVFPRALLSARKKLEQISKKMDPKQAFLSPDLDRSPLIRHTFDDANAFQVATKPQRSNRRKRSLDESNRISEADDDSHFDVRSPSVKTIKRNRLSPHAKEQLTRWVLENQDCPYPTLMTKHALAASTGLTVKQVNDWMVNIRKRRLRPQSRKALLFQSEAIKFISPTIEFLTNKAIDSIVCSTTAGAEAVTNDSDEATLSLNGTVSKALAHKDSGSKEMSMISTLLGIQRTTALPMIRQMNNLSYWNSCYESEDVLSESSGSSNDQPVCEHADDSLASTQSRSYHHVAEQNDASISILSMHRKLLPSESLLQQPYLELSYRRKMHGQRNLHYPNVDQDDAPLFDASLFDLQAQNMTTAQDDNMSMLVFLENAIEFHDI